MTRALTVSLPVAKRRAVTLTDALFLSTLLFAAALYLTGIVQNLPMVHEADEPSRVLRSVHMVATKTLNPNWFGHPSSTVIYPLVGIFYLWNVLLLGGPLLPPDPALIQTFEANPAPFYIVGRLVTIAYGLLSLPLVYLIGRRIFGARVALLGVWCTLTYTVIAAHAQVARSDSAGLFYAMLSLYLALRYYNDQTLASRVLAGAAVGMAVSSRYFMVFFVLPLAAVELLRLWQLRRGGQLSLREIALMACGPLAVGAAFVLTTPYFLLDLKTVMSDLQRESRAVQLGADGLSPLGNFLWYLGTGVPLNVTPLQALLAVGGAALALWRRRWLQALLAGLILVYLGALSAHNLHWQRWTIQVLPLVALLAASALVFIADSLARVLRGAPAVRQFSLVLVVVAVLGVPGCDALLFGVRQAGDSTRVLATAWARANLPPGTRIMQDWYTTGLASPEYRVEERRTIAREATVDGYRKAGVQYFVVSDEIYNRIFAEPARYPNELAFYREVFSTLPLVAQFVPAPVRPGTEETANRPTGRPGAGGGPLIRVYRLSDG